MSDPHMNLFYSYNHDNELTENNLTRAFLVTLKHLGSPLRTHLISRILGLAASDRGRSNPAEGLDFGNVEFALQGHVDRSVVAHAKRKCLLVISSTPALETPSLPQDTYPSIPDGWILAPDGEYCILIESKVGTNPVDLRQIAAHARQWLHVDDPEEVKRTISWNRISDALADECEDANATQASSLEQEMLSGLLEFLRLFGYRSFRGLRMRDQQGPPSWQLSSKPPVPSPGLRPASLLAPPPQFKTGTA